MSAVSGQEPLSRLRRQLPLQGSHRCRNRYWLPARGISGAFSPLPAHFPLTLSRPLCAHSFPPPSRFTSSFHFSVSALSQGVRRAFPAFKHPVFSNSIEFSIQPAVSRIQDRFQHRFPPPTVGDASPCSPSLPPKPSPSLSSPPPTSRTALRGKVVGSVLSCFVLWCYVLSCRSVILA